MLFPCVKDILTKNGNKEGINEVVSVPNAFLLDGEQGNAQDTHMGLLERTVKNFADQAYRTILIAFRDLTMEEYN
jgi:hypothetical protein